LSKFNINVNLEDKDVYFVHFQKALQYFCLVPPYTYACQTLSNVILGAIVVVTVTIVSFIGGGNQKYQEKTTDLQ
jgi:hypothetical protein